MSSRFAQGCVLLALAAFSPVTAQAEFDRAYQEAQRLSPDADAETRSRSWRRAWRAFLQLDPASVEYRPRLAAGAWSGLQCGDTALAHEVLVAQGADLPADAVGVWLPLVLAEEGADRALAESIRFEEQHGAVVDGFVYGNAAQLLPASGAALRRGERDLGLWLFARFAASGDPIAQGNYALALRNLGQGEEAVAWYRRALEQAERDPVLWNDFGLCLKSLGRIGAAEAAFRRSLEVEESLGMGPGVTNLLLLSRNEEVAFAEAGESLRALLRKRPDAAIARRIQIDRILGR